VVTGRHTDKPTPVKRYSLAFAGIIKEKELKTKSICSDDSANVIVGGVSPEREIVDAGKDL